MKKPLALAALVAGLVTSVATSPPRADFEVNADAFADEATLRPGTELVYLARVAATLDVAPAAEVEVVVERTDGAGALRLDVVLPSGQTRTEKQTVAEARESTTVALSLPDVLADCDEVDAEGLCWRELEVVVRAAGAEPVLVQPTVRIVAVGDFADDAEGDARVDADIVAADE